MSNSAFLVTNNIPETQNPNYTYMMNNYNDHHQDFEFFDCFVLADHPEEDSTSSFTACLSQQTPISQENTSGSSVNSINGNMPRSIDDHIKFKNGMKRIKMDAGYRIAFRTKSELEIMDDGYKWRKYGKKKVKNSPNPRNYYKCSNGECNVKKRVERDREDPSFVITTYEGVHNHESPCVILYSEMPPPPLPTGRWTTPLHPSHFSP